MQLNIKFKKGRITLPISTNKTVQGLIYRALAEDPKYSAQLHESGKSCDGRRFKLFTFSELKGRYEVQGHTITFIDEANLLIRSADAYFIQLLFTYFTKNHYVNLGENLVEVDDIALVDNHIHESSITARTLSPITVYLTEENGHTVYFSPNDKQFYNAIERNARRKWISYFGNDNDFQFEIQPIENARFFKRATKFKDTFITAWHGTFILKAPPKVLNFLYHTGIGCKNSQGFGMLAVEETNN